MGIEEDLQEGLDYIDTKDEDDGDGEESSIEEVLADLAHYGVAQQLGFDLQPTKGDFTKLLKAVIEDETAIRDKYASEIDSLSGQISDIGEFGPRASYLQQQKGELEAGQQRELEEFWGMAMPLIDPWRGMFEGKGAKERAERPGDPLGEYFQAVDRLQAEVLGPSPESRFISAPDVSEAIGTTTPTDFQTFLKGQGKEMQARYFAEVFEEYGPQVKDFAGELAKLPEYDEESDSYPRLERFMQLQAELGLDQIPTYEDFIEETVPEMQSRYKYLNPLTDEDTESVFRTAFGKDIGVGGAQITPFGQFAGQQREALESEFADLTRTALDEGGAMEDLVSYEEFLGGYVREGKYHGGKVEALEESFRLSSPYTTGRKRPGSLGRPTRKL